MKKVFVLILAALIVIGFIGCGGTPDDDGAGLYDTDTNELVYSWSKMVSMGWIDENCAINSSYADKISGSLILPESLTSIPDSAFEYCLNLEDVQIPKSVNNIGDSAFECCSALEQLTIPSNVKNIKDEAFYTCLNLKSVIITEGVSEIGDFAFAACKSLERIEIPKSVKKIGSRVFYDSKNLSKIIYNGTRAEWRNIDKPTSPHNASYSEFQYDWNRGMSRYTIECIDGSINFANEDI